MAAGRKTGGRKKGSVNKATAAHRTAIVSSGLTPLEFMLKLLRGEPVTVKDSEGKDTEYRPSVDDMRWAASSAAPYVHPRLAAVEHSGDVTVRHEDALKDLE